MKHGSLFSGIGGFDLAAEWMGWENVFHCEWKEFNQKILKYYWPNAISYTDITKTDFTPHRGTIDILTGGFPCQPYSLAGKRKGKEDDRHLWPEMLRAIREIQPRYIVGENVGGLVNWSGGLVFEEVQSQMEAEGYEVQAFILPACAVNAPHRRDRVWLIANSSDNYRGCAQSNRDEKTEFVFSKSQRFSEKWDFIENDTNPIHEGLQRNEQYPKNKREDRERGKGAHGAITEFYRGNNWSEWPTQSPICIGNDGISSKLDGITFPKWRTESLMSAGNAIVPQVALQIFKAIQQFNQQ